MLAEKVRNLGLDPPGLAFRRGSSPPVEPRRNGTPSFDALELGSFL
jgi:hypothetical protein